MPIHQTELGGIMNIPTGRNLYTAVNNGDEWDGMQKIICSPSGKYYATYLPQLKLLTFHAQKTGSSSIISYLRTFGGKTDYCQGKYWGPTKPSIELQKNMVSTGIFSTRPPIERFSSGAGEIFHRKCSSEVWSSTNNETRSICYNTYNLQIEDNATAMAECLIREHEYATAYCEGEHVWSHGFSASRTGYKALPGVIDDGPYIHHLLSQKDIEIQLPHLLEEAANMGNISGFEYLPNASKRINVGNTIIKKGGSALHTQRK